MLSWTAPSALNGRRQFVRQWTLNFYRIEQNWTELNRTEQNLFCQFISLTNWVNSGKFMDNCWISSQLMVDMKIFYNDLIIINLYKQDISSTD